MLEHINNQPQNPSRVVILGAAGFVGAAVAKQLTDSGVSVLALGHKDMDLMADGAGAKLAGMLKSTDSLLVISAQAPVKDNDMLANNITMMLAVCEAIGIVKPAHIVYVSSDAVYADSMEPLSEKSCAQPDSLHGTMHLAREVMLKNAYNGPLGIIRPTLIYGVNDPHNGYGPNRFRRIAADGQDIVLFGEGEERRDHILVDDVAKLVLLMLAHKSQGVLNATTGVVTSFRKIAQSVVKLFDNPVLIKGSPRSGAMPHNGYRPFNSAATYAVFPNFEYTSLSEGLKKSHRDMIEKK